MQKVPGELEFNIAKLEKEKARAEQNSEEEMQ